MQSMTIDSSAWRHFRYSGLCGQIRQCFLIQVRWRIHGMWSSFFRVIICNLFGTKTISTGGELRNGVNGFLTSYATYSQKILDKDTRGWWISSMDDKNDLQSSVCRNTNNSQHCIMYLIRHYKSADACMIKETCFSVPMHGFMHQCVPQTLSFGSYLLINSLLCVYSCSCSWYSKKPRLDTDSFIKNTWDWQGTCNKLFTTTKQIIDDSLFSVADYCRAYLGIRRSLQQCCHCHVKLSSGLNECTSPLKKVSLTIVCRSFSALMHH